MGGDGIPDLAPNQLLFGFYAILARVGIIKNGSMTFSFSGPEPKRNWGRGSGHDGAKKKKYRLYARKMAARAARPATAIEFRVVLAAPVKAMGEPVG